MLGSRHLSKRISKAPKSAVICWILAVCGSADVLYIPLMPSAHLQSKHSWVITVRFARTAITQRPVWTTESVWAELSKWRLGNGDDLWGNGDIVLSLVLISGLIIDRILSVTDLCIIYTHYTWRHLQNGRHILEKLLQLHFSLFLWNLRLLSLNPWLLSLNISFELGFQSLLCQENVGWSPRCNLTSFRHLPSSTHTHSVVDLKVIISIDLHWSFSV